VVDLAYYGDRYWEREAPTEVFTGRFALTFYKEAGKLQVSRLYVDGGKTVTLDAEEMQLNPAAVDVLKGFLAGIGD